MAIRTDWQVTRGHSCHYLTQTKHNAGLRSGLVSPALCARLACGLHNLLISRLCSGPLGGGSITMIDVHKSTVLPLLMMLVMLSSWQVAEGADGGRGRHSLIHRPQIHPAPALTPALPGPQPQLQSSLPSRSIPLQSVHRKVVKRPATPVSPVAEVSPVDPGNWAPIDSPPITSQSYNPEDAPPEAEMFSPPEPQESPNPDSR